MQLGRHLRELFGLRRGLVLALTLGILAAVWSVARISVLPPALHPRSLQMSAAQTRVLVDSPKSSLLDLAMSTNDIQSITNRALLIANVMASAPVRSYIADRAHVPSDVLQISSPVTPTFARPLAMNGRQPKTKDILRAPGEYRLSLTANPTVPIIDVYAVAPDKQSAQLLADGAVAGMRDYLNALGDTQRIAPQERVDLEQLGAAKGSVIDPGVNRQVAALAFLLVFAAASAAALFASRVRRGWVAESRRSRPLDATEPSR